MPKTVLLIVAAGRGMRAGGEIPKQYQQLAGQAVLTHTLEALKGHPLISHMLTIIHPDDIELYEAATRPFGINLLPPVFGGETRQKSVLKGLLALEELNPDLVLIHDAARPFISPRLITHTIEALAHHEAVLPAVPVTDTIKQAKNETIMQTVDRQNLFAAQTPQGFKFPLILDLHKRADLENNVDFTDDASLAEGAGVKVQLVKGSPRNTKLTTKRDMEMAELVLANTSKMETRFGSGFDVHAFEEGDGVTLCGIKIPFDRQLKGHSDADVAMHALTDALYGALGKGDIGQHFPPSDIQWKGVASSVFLKHAVELVTKRGGKIINTDLTIICEQPKISPHQEAMRQNISKIIGIEAHRIAIKATTTEGLGFTGRKEGIAAQAIANISLPVQTENGDV
ncbi:MAG: bifunctional 2-C-methyl-D-erythritol 4-phosphate cytidylyltransferase/2-C-methyl-D-erythritol 2,4-cyclodiphosphate synthase [Hyphomicrobiaceae bacterium]|nr:bifunctional 2-C-methyl-D-erythritol 4-phosphate cytidylyltransferase/2-C-methyl-D-erythritol 2,4-cyclodiphosphate synthase [Hyphomicrobiaceae bacterium]